MNRTVIPSTLLALFALAACDNRPAVVAVPTPAPAPGPAGAPGPQGEAGKPGASTSVIVTPPAAASAASN